MLMILPAKNVYILIFIPVKDKGLPWLLSCKPFSVADCLRIMESLKDDRFSSHFCLSMKHIYIYLYLLSKAVLHDYAYLVWSQSYNRTLYLLVLETKPVWVETTFGPLHLRKQNENAKLKKKSRSKNWKDSVHFGDNLSYVVILPYPSCTQQSHISTC